MNKRIVLCIAVITAAVGSAAWAVGQPEAVNLDQYPLEGEITFAHSVSGWHRAYFTPIFEAFEAEYPGIDVVSIEMADGGYEALTQSVLLGAAAGDIPDVSQVGFSFLRTLAESGRGVVLDPYMDADDGFSKDVLLPGMRSLGVVDGDTYLIPLATSTPVMFINDALFEAAGLDPADPPQSWAEVRTASEALKAQDAFGIYYSWEITGNWVFQTLIENAGGTMAAADGTAAFDSPEAVAAMQYVDDLIEDELMPRVNDASALFLTGRLGMLVTSSAGLLVLGPMAQFPFRTVPVPTMDGSAPRLPAGGTGVMMFAEDLATRRVAWEFLKFLSGPTASGLVGRNSGYLPANLQVIDELKSEFGDNPSRALLFDQAAQVVPWHSWPGGRGPEIASIIAQAEEAIILGDADVEDSLQAAASEVNHLIGE